jgi:hypothetical protein
MVPSGHQYTYWTTEKTAVAKLLYNQENSHTAGSKCIKRNKAGGQITEDQL